MEKTVVHKYWCVYPREIHSSRKLQERQGTYLDGIMYGRIRIYFFFVRILLDTLRTYSHIFLFRPYLVGILYGRIHINLNFVLSFGRYSAGDSYIPYTGSHIFEYCSLQSCFIKNRMPPNKPKATVIQPHSTTINVSGVSPFIVTKQLKKTAAASDNTRTASVRRNKYITFREKGVRLLNLPENKYNCFIYIRLLKNFFVCWFERITSL